MIFRKTDSTKRKKMVINKWGETGWVVVRCTTYWFLLLPIYTRDDEVFR